MVINIRLASPEDFPQMAKVVALAWRQAYGELIFPEDMERFTNEQRRIGLYKEHYRPDWDSYVAAVDGTVRGVCMAEEYTEVRQPNAAIVHQMYIEPDFQRMRLGKKLLSHTLRGLRGKGYKKAFLFVMEGNTPAIKFYEKFGFVTDGYREKNEGMVCDNYGLRYWIEL